jgi:glycosyltransferase involved in cell wall biosynthesis
MVKIIDGPPLVSIGLPVYNGQKYIEQAIDSILTQTYHNFELIICDNGSTDRTQEIYEAFIKKDKRINYFRNEKNLGAAPNFNKVFNLSSGKYFKWAAYDDLLAPEFLSRCVDVLESMPDVVLCFPKSMIIDEKGNQLGIHKFNKSADSNEPQIRFRDIVLYPDTAFQVFGLGRRDIFSKTGLIGNYPASDMVLLAELALHGRFYEIPDPLFYPRYHPDQSIRGVYTAERDRVTWFDTSLKGKIQLPKWKYLYSYFEVVNNSNLDLADRLVCYSVLIRWAFLPDHIRALAKDLVLAAIRFVNNGFRTEEKALTS